MVNDGVGPMEVPNDLLAAEIRSLRERLFAATQAHDWILIRSRAKDLSALAAEVVQDGAPEGEAVSTETRQAAQQALEEAKRLAAAAESRLAALGADSEGVLEEVREQFRVWRRGTRNYGGLSILVRLSLLSSTAIVAGTTNIEGDPGNNILQSLVDWTPLFAIAAAGLTALDTWLKPRDKWRGFMEMRDRARAMMTRLTTLRDGKVEADVLGYLDQLAEMRTEHRDRNVI
ncbi:MAG: hypothetical protein O3A10_15135 [Chloroflexi bacterium]|nr:hypothetical protein [Chloroflexota bacterium]MDA1147834.1 hypothetical protein [Chloroflexota bacterium]